MRRLTLGQAVLGTLFLAVLLLWGRAFPPLPTLGDETDYYKLSHSLSAGTGYAVPEGGAMRPTRFPPGYPAALSLFVPLERSSPALLVLPAVLCFAASLPLMLLLYRRAAAATWITALYAFNFVSVYNAFRLRSEHPFMLLLFSAMLLYRRYAESGSRLALAAAFLAAYAAAFTRTIGWVLPLSMMILLLKGGKKRPLAAAAAAAAALLWYYLGLTDTGNYLYRIGELPRPHGRFYQAAFDASVHLGRNMLDFLSGFWTAGFTRENSPPWLFALKTGASLALSGLVIKGLDLKVRERGWEIEDLFFALYPVTFFALGMYSEMYRYFLPVLPMSLAYLFFALERACGRRPAKALFFTLLPLYAARTATALLRDFRFYN